MHDPRAVAAIVSALRQVHGDETARLMLQDGMTLEALIDALRRAPLSDRDFARLISTALESGDFDIAPVIAGESVGLIRDIPSANEIVRRIIAEAEALLNRAPNGVR